MSWPSHAASERAVRSAASSPETTRRHGRGSLAQSAASTSGRADCATASVASFPAESSLSRGAISGAASSRRETRLMNMNGAFRTQSGRGSVEPRLAR